MNILRLALTSNAIFSLFTGTVLILFPTYTSNLFGVQQISPFWILGILLILFGLFVFLLSRKNPIPLAPALAVTCLDVLWVIGSATLLLFDPFTISLAGNIIIGSVAFIVLVFAIGQSNGLSVIDSLPETGSKEFRFEREVRAGASAVWELISDVSHYHHVAPNIDDVEILTGSGEGMVRKCRQGKNSWTEKCINWIEGKEFSFLVNTSEPDYPFPLSFLQGTWKVEALDKKHSKILMVFEFKYKKRMHNLLLHAFMAPQFKNIAEELLDNWEDKLNEGNAS